MKQKIFLLLSLTLFILSFGQILFNLLQILPKKNFIDFFVYNGAVEKFVNLQNPYNFLYGQPPDKVPFNYPPSALLVLLPLKLFPLKAAQIILVVLSFLAFWLTFWVILKISKTKISLSHFLILVAFFNQTFPVKFTLVLGQINLIVLGLAYAGIYLYTKYKIFAVSQLSEQASDDRALDFRGRGRSERSRRYAGMRVDLTRKFLYFGSILFLSLASSLKIFPLFTLPLFLIPKAVPISSGRFRAGLKDFGFVFSVIGIFLALNILPSFNLFKQYYFQIVPNLSRAVGIPNFYDQSLLAFLLRLNLPIFWAKILTLVILFALFWWILAKFYRHRGVSLISLDDRPLLFSFSFIFALFSIGNLFSWQHHLVFAYPLVFIVYLKTLERQKNLKAKLFYNFLFLFLWLVFVFHFKTETSPYLSNPFIASHQTIAVLFFIAYSLIRS